MYLKNAFLLSFTISCLLALERVFYLRGSVGSLFLIKEYLLDAVV